MATRATKKVQSITLRDSLSKITMTHVLATLLIMSSFVLGSLWTRVQYLEKGGTITGTTNTATTNTAPQPQAAPTEDTSPKKVSVDDDPVIGDKNAKVTIVEFSDFECPFCKQFYERAYSDIKKNYIDTGKVKLVYRDMPLSFHDPMATNEALAANCAREQGTDETYFLYHDAMFKKTTSNGTGLTKDDLTNFASELGLNVANFTSCLDTQKYKEEVAKDIVDAAAVGASATPSFYIGKSTDNGVIEGTPLIGAYPFENFKAIIDQQLQ